MGITCSTSTDVPPVYQDAVYDEKTKIIYGPPEVFVPDPKGLGHAFFMYMKRHSRHIAQIDGNTGNDETFGSILRRSIRTALEMQRRGIRPGHVVSLCSRNNMDNVVPFIAAQLVGAIMASFDPTISLVDTEHLIKQVKPKMIFVSQESEKLIEDALNNTELTAQLIVFGRSESYESFQKFSAPQVNEEEFQPHEVTDLKTTAVILFSSGTTGLSKGICIHHYGISYQAYTLVNSGCNFDTYISFASTYWVSTVVLLAGSILFGKTRFISAYNPAELWKHIDKYKITFMFMAPSQAIHWMKAGRPNGVNTTSLQDIIIGGGVLSEDNNLALREILPGTNIHMLYGQSEAAGMITSFCPANRKDVMLLNNKPKSSGTPSLGYKYKFVDTETGKLLGPYAQGEVRYFANCIMNGYYNIDSTGAFDEDGWIVSGDVGYFDDDLCFYIVDRIKEMLKFQSFHIPPARIEGVLLTHPEVAVAVVIGIPDEDDGDHPMALVVLRPDATVTPGQLIRYVDERVDDRYRLRAGVKIIESVPFTPSGKIKKHLLKKMVLAGEI